MKKKYFLISLLSVFPLLLSSCQNNEEELIIELDEYTPTAIVGEEYDFTDVLYVEKGVKYKLEVYYQNYNTMEEFSLPVVDDFYFTPVDIFDLTVIVNASKGNKKAKRIRQVPVAYNPEPATRYNLEMCNFEPGEWRGTGSSAEISYSEKYGANSKSSRKISFKNSWNLPDESAVDSASTVNASFNLATTSGLGTDTGIDSKICILSFDIKLSNEFYDDANINANRHLFSLKIEDDSWIPNSTVMNLVESITDFTPENTDNGWLHVEQNIYENGGLDGLGNGTYVITLGFYGITNQTKNNAFVILDNLSLTEIPIDQRGNRETPSRNNIEMCRFEPGAYRGTGSKAVISYTELKGNNSTSSRKVTFANSEGLPDVVDNNNHSTVNASFNLANTWSIGTENGIDAKNCILSFDIKLSEEFYNSGHQYRHMFSLKIEDETWVPQLTWISFVNNASDFTYENTDNGWMHFEYDMSLNEELAALGNSVYVMTFGFFGITNTTRESANIVFDNIKLVDK